MRVIVAGDLQYDDPIIVNYCIGNNCDCKNTYSYIDTEIIVIMIISIILMIPSRTKVISALKATTTITRLSE